MEHLKYDLERPIISRTHWWRISNNMRDCSRYEILLNLAFYLFTTKQKRFRRNTCSCTVQSVKTNN